MTVVALLSAVCFGLGSCSSPPQPTDDFSGGGINADTDGLQNRATWSMPLDEFYVYSPDLGSYAEQLLIGRCLAGEGFAWPVPWRDTDFPLPANFNEAGYRLFDVAIASQWGYHQAPVLNQEEFVQWGEFEAHAQSLASDPAFLDAFAACDEKARLEDTSRDVDGFNYISDLAVQASQVAQERQEVQAAVAAWRECLTSKVDFVVPTDPWTEMPPLAVAERFGIVGPNQTTAASTEEIAAAVADAECRESSGASAALYEAQWDAQSALVDENRNQLDRIRRDAAEHELVLLNIVAENAPPSA